VLVEGDSGYPEVSLQKTVVYPQTRFASNVSYLGQLAAVRTLNVKLEFSPRDELMTLLQPSQQLPLPSLYLVQEWELGLHVRDASILLRQSKNWEFICHIVRGLNLKALADHKFGDQVRER
jgi:hypothetical protein